MSHVQKGIHPRTQRLLVFIDCYGNNLAYINGLVDILKTDFPEANDSAIFIEEFDNIHRKGVMCVSFDNAAQKLPVPATYETFPLDWVRTRPA